MRIDGVAIRMLRARDTWVAQLVKRPYVAHVMISWFKGFEPHIGLAAVSAEPASDPLSPSLSALPPLVLSLKINKLKKKEKKRMLTARSYWLGYSKNSGLFKQCDHSFWRILEQETGMI